MSKAIISFSRAPTTPDGVFKLFLGLSNNRQSGFPVYGKLSASQFLAAYPRSPFAGLGATIDVSGTKLVIELDCPPTVLARIAEIACTPVSSKRPRNALRMYVEFAGINGKHTFKVRQRSVVDCVDYRNWDHVKAKLRALTLPCDMQSGNVKVRAQLKRMINQLSFVTASAGIKQVNAIFATNNYKAFAELHHIY